MPKKSLSPKKQRAGKSKTQKKRPRAKRKAQTIVAPPLVWPEYPTGPTTVEQMHEIDLKQKEYIAYHGTSPWSHENLWGPDEESASESDGSQERDEVETKAEERGPGSGTYCPESLEDDDILRAIEAALAMARQGRDDQQPPHHLQAPIGMQTPSTSEINTNRPTAQLESRHPTENMPDRTQAFSADIAIPLPEVQEPERHGGELSRLRPRDRLRKTEKAVKIYRV